MNKKDLEQLKKLLKELYVSDYFVLGPTKETKYIKSAIEIVHSIIINEDND